jgi:WD40 repeat protein
LRQVVIAEDTENGVTWLVRWDLTTGEEIGRRRPPSDSVVCEVPWPDGRYILFACDHTIWPFDAVREYVSGIPFMGRFFPDESNSFLVVDAATDSELARVHPSNPWIVELSPDGRTLVSASHDGQLEFWDIPPRKPLSWLAIAAGIWALPVVWFARRRVRKLASGVA